MAFPYTILKPIYSFYNDFYHEKISVKHSEDINTEIQINNMNNKKLLLYLIAYNKMIINFLK